MKILVVGDFHGKFPLKLQRLVKDVDLVLSVGDYKPWRLVKEFFRECYGTDKELWEVVGKKKYKENFLADLKDAKKVLEKLNFLKVDVVSTIGNYDLPMFNDSFKSRKKKKNGWDYANKDLFSPMMKKYRHIKRVDYRAVKVGGIVVIGGFGHSNRGNVKSAAYRKHRKVLDKLFSKYKKENDEGKVVFLFHNMPYDCKLDKVRNKNAPKIVRGKHIGNKLIRRIIDRYQPVLGIGGHIHENQGQCRIGKTLVINGGAAIEGECALIDFDVEKGKVKSVKFVK